MDISIVVPLYNEEGSLPELYKWIERVMKANAFSFEVIFVNDGSTDHSWQVIEDLSSKSENVKGIKFRRNYGKSPALYCGFKEAQGDVVITMDADLQDSPDEIPALYRMIVEEGYDLVSGYKQKRYAPLSKPLPTTLFNATARKISGIHGRTGRKVSSYCNRNVFRKRPADWLGVFGAGGEMGEGKRTFFRRAVTLAHNPSGTPCHLPLHRGGWEILLRATSPCTGEAGRFCCVPPPPT